MSIPTSRAVDLVESTFIGSGKDTRISERAVLKAVLIAANETRQSTIEEIINATAELNPKLANLLRIKFGHQ